MTHFKYTETTSQLADDAGLLEYLAHRGHRRLLFRLDAAAWHDPVIRTSRRSHQKHLHTSRHSLNTQKTYYNTITSRTNITIVTNLRFGIRTHADTRCASPKSLLVIYSNRIRLLFNHFLCKHERNKQSQTKSRHQI